MKSQKGDQDKSQKKAKTDDSLNRTQKVLSIIATVGTIVLTSFGIKEKFSKK